MHVEQNPAIDRRAPPESVPLEMILVLVWTGMPLFHSLVTLEGQAIVLGWAMLSGTAMIAYTLFEIVVVGACYYGILTRRMWARPLAIGWALYGFGLSAINPLALLFHQDRPVWVLRKWLGSYASDAASDSAVTVMVGWHFILLFAITAAVVVYLHRARGFFRAQAPS